MNDERARYIYIPLYDAEKYHNNEYSKVTKTLNIHGKTKEEIDDIIKKLKDDQAEKNRKFREMHPRKGPAKVYYERQAELKNSVPPLSTGFEGQRPRKKSLEIQFDSGTGNTFALFGASKSGKTTLMMKLYNEYFPQYCKLNHILATLFAMNSQLKIYDDKFIIKSSQFNNNSANYIDWQRKTNKMNNNKFTFLNMFDDFIDVRYKDIVNNLILTYRNSNMSAIICLQYVNLLSKSARSNINNVFLLHMNTDESIEVVIRVYLAAYTKKMDNPIEWYKDITSDHNYLYLHTMSGKIYSSKLSEYIN